MIFRNFLREIKLENNFGFTIFWREKFRKLENFSWTPCILTNPIYNIKTWDLDLISMLRRCCPTPFRDSRIACDSCLDHHHQPGMSKQNNFEYIDILHRPLKRQIVNKRKVKIRENSEKNSENETWSGLSVNNHSVEKFFKHLNHELISQN